MNELFAVAIITVLAVISPGGDFAMVTRNSLMMGRRAGLLTACGIALGTWIHVGYTMVGVAVLAQTFPWLLDVIKILGAGYLIYIGVQTMLSKPPSNTGVPVKISDFQALKTGFLTNALNPKTTLFVVSLYSQVVGVGTPFAVQLGYGAFISVAHGFWFALVAWVFSNQKLVEHALSKQVLVNRMIGVVLIGLGTTLALSSIY